MITGITGSFGTGKTTVANMFSKYGFKVINADKLYHGIYNKNNSLKNRIKNEFGTTNRNALKKIVFNDHNKLKKLNKLTHPIIINEIKNKINDFLKNNEKVNIVIDAPLLIEAKMQGMVDKIVAVNCNEKIQIKRLLKKGRHTKEEIKNIIKSQMPVEEKLKYADFVVDNSKTIKETERQVKRIITNLCNQNA